MMANNGEIRIMLVEDNPADVRLIREMLKKPGGDFFKLDHAETLSAGLGLLTQSKYDIMLLDLDLPDSQGLETVRKARQSDRDIPIVILTGLTDSEVGDHALRTGAQDYLVKWETSEASLVRSIRYAFERKQIEEQFRLQADLYNTVLATTGDGFLRINADAGLLDVNEAFCGMSGYSRDELLNMRISDLETIETPEEIERHIKKVMEMGFDRFETRHRRKDGALFDIEVSISYRKAECQFLLFIRDITERKQAEEKTRRSEVRYQELFDSVIEGIAFVDADEIVQMCNPAFARFYDFEKPAEIIGKSVLDFASDEQKRLVLGQAEIRRRNESSTYEHDIITAKGNRKTLRVSATPRFGQAGEYIGSFGAIIDITRRKRAEEALKANEEKLRSIFAHVTSGVAVYELLYDDRGRAYDARLLDFNPEFEKQQGIKKENAIGGSLLETEPVAGPEWIRQYAEVIQSGMPMHFERKNPATGKYFNVFAYSPRPREVVAMFIDITERKALEGRLRESEEKARSLIEHAPTFIYEIDFRTRKFTMVNDMLCEYIGYTREELLEMNPFDLLDEEGKSVLRERIPKWLRGEKPDDNVEYKIRTKQGREFYAILHTTFTTENGTPVGAMVIGHDITERKRFEETLEKRVAERTEELAESENRYRTIVEAAGEGIAKTNADGVIEFVNNQMARMLGYTPDEMIGRHYTLFMSDETREESEKAMISHKQGQAGSREACLLHKDGRTVFTYLSSTPQFNASGQFSGSLALVTNITEHRKAQMALMESEARYRALFEHSYDAFALYEAVTNEKGETVDATVLAINKAFEIQAGVKAEDVIGKRYGESANDVQKIGLLPVFLHTARTGNSQKIESESSDGRYFSITCFSPKPGQVAVFARDITDRKINEARGKVRYSLLSCLRSAKTVEDSIRCGCNAVKDAGPFERAVLIIQNRENGRFAVGHIGLLKHEIAAITKSQIPDKELIQRFAGKLTRIGNSFFMPWSGAPQGLVRTSLFIPPSIIVNKKKLSAQTGSAIFVPVEDVLGEYEGWLSVALPAGQEKPDNDTVKLLEEIVESVSRRIREIHYETRLSEEHHRLEEKNIALREILAGIEEKLLESRRQIAQAVSQTLIPSFNKMVKKNGAINEVYYNLHKRNLEEFARATGSILPLGSKLSPREMEICSLIKNGANSKEIAESLDIALTTVQKHREIIRKKLGIVNRKYNLTSYLRGL